MSAPSRRPRSRTSSPSTWAIAGSRPRPLRHLAQPVGEAGRVEAAGVADDLDAALEREPEAVLELTDEGLRVAQRRVLHRVLAEDQHGQLGEVVAGQDVEALSIFLATLEHLAHRGEPVAVEAGAVADASLRCARPSPAGPANAWAIVSHCSASAPTATQVGVVAVHPLGHQQAEVLGRAGHRLRGVLGPPGPHVAPTGRPGRSGTPPRAARSSCTENAKLRVRTPRWATCRIRSVGSGSMPRAS